MAGHGEQLAGRERRITRRTRAEATHPRFATRWLVLDLSAGGAENGRTNPRRLFFQEPPRGMGQATLWASMARTRPTAAEAVFLQRQKRMRGQSGEQCLCGFRGESAAGQTAGGTEGQFSEFRKKPWMLRQMQNRLQDVLQERFPVVGQWRHQSKVRLSVGVEVFGGGCQRTGQPCGARAIEGMGDIELGIDPLNVQIDRSGRKGRRRQGDEWREQTSWM